ncbi:hypothetical protein GW17_00026860 [Ensete ventricosum]|nr:hypothetical protein GW17_00026860 [Ensete ventricosum]
MCISRCFCSDVHLKMLLFGGSCGVIHESLVEVGKPDMAPQTIKSMPQSKWSKIWRADHTLSLTSAIKPSMVGRCGPSLSIRSTWCRDMTCHSLLIGSLRSLRCCDGQVSALPPRPGPALVGSSWDLGTVVDY